MIPAILQGFLDRVIFIRMLVSRLLDLRSGSLQRAYESKQHLNPISYPKTIPLQSHAIEGLFSGIIYPKVRKISCRSPNDLNLHSPSNLSV
jgi:hypothetical protein